MSVSGRNTAKKRLFAEIANAKKDTVLRRPSSTNQSMEDDDLPALESEDDSDDDFRKNITDLYLKNKLSAKDTCKVIRSAGKAGAEGVADMEKNL